MALLGGCRDARDDSYYTPEDVAHGFLHHFAVSAPGDDVIECSE